MAAPGPELVSMAQQFTGLPMESLIGGPLDAAATANAAMALTQTKFLLDTCFYRVALDPDGKPVDPQPDPIPKDKDSGYSPIMIKMSLIRGVITPGTPAGPGGNPAATDAKITQVVTTFDLPLLTIVPLNSLAVQTVDITFEMEVKSSYSESDTTSSTTEKKAEASLEATLGWAFLKVTVKGSVSYDQKDTSTHDTHYEKSNSAKYTVNVHAGQLPMPKGVNTIIEAFTKAIEPITLPVAKTN